MTNRLVAIVTCSLLSMVFGTSALAEDSTTTADAQPTAHLRSTSFVTTQIDQCIAFYTQFLGYTVLRESLIEQAKSRQVVGAQQEGEVRFVILAPADWSEEDNKYTGISFIQIPWAVSSPFDQDATRPSRGAELVLSHRVTNIDEIERRMRKADVPFIAALSASGSGKSKSMAVLDPNGTRVEMYEYLERSE